MADDEELDVHREYLERYVAEALRYLGAGLAALVKIETASKQHEIRTLLDDASRSTYTAGRAIDDARKGLRRG